MRRCLAAATVLVILTVWGCGQPQKAEPGKPAPVTPAKSEGKAGSIRVAFVPNASADFWKIAEAGTQKAAREFGCTVDFRIPATGVAQEQQQILEDQITRGVSGIAISPCDPENQMDILNKAAAKVNLITQDSDAPNSNRLCYIGTNNYEAGKAAAALIKQVIPEGGKIMLFVGSLDAQNAQDRRKGIVDALAGSNISVIDTRTDDRDQAKAIANVQDTLVAYPDVACLVGLWAYNGPAILNAVKTSGKQDKVKIVCFDEEDETLRGVKDGLIYGTVVQQPFEFGYQSVRLLVQLAQGDKSAIPADKQIFIPTVPVTKEDVDAFWTKLKSLLGKS